MEEGRKKEQRCPGEGEAKEIDHMQSGVYGFVTSHAYHCADL